jgi:hypothetical protein
LGVVVEMVGVVVEMVGVVVDVCTIPRRFNRGKAGLK